MSFFDLSISSSTSSALSGLISWGVLWKGSEGIDGVPETIDFLRKMVPPPPPRRGKKLLFISNNSSKARADYRSKFAEFNITTAEEEIFNSGFATAMYLKSIGFSKTAYIVGEEGLQKEFTKAGIKSRGVREHSFVPDKLQNILDVLQVDPDIGAIVVGFDSTLTYAKIAFAFHQLQNNPDCLFIATNMDSSLPSPKGLLPGGGTNVAMLQLATGRTPIVIGKPEPIALDLIKKSYHIDPSRTLMVGDRLDTDIAFGQRGGLKTLLVFTGVAGPKDIAISAEATDSSKIIPETTPSVADKESGHHHHRRVFPDYYMASFGDFYRFLKDSKK